MGRNVCVSPKTPSFVKETHGRGALMAILEMEPVALGYCPGYVTNGEPHGLTISSDQTLPDALHGSMSL
jgi:hypothetical protein